MACKTCGSRGGNIVAREFKNIDFMENYIIDENYDISKLDKSVLDKNIFPIKILDKGFEVRNGEPLKAYLIYKRNEAQDSIVTLRTLVTVKRQIASKYGNSSNTRKLLAVPIIDKKFNQNIENVRRSEITETREPISSTTDNTPRVKARGRPRKNK